ncbi:mitochondrial outer membrane translocase complex, subunit Tom22 [Macrophomina phaseolina]|uniref:Mitochondrial outer membrane translocase complex, subunit Tom22 n=1 Tax=Macrophomina phaseolina TaxID=35725 RepID=A0ABQ8GAP4_9PEZI|nr:mitochondrial outer membrane translocase complex, subunit Tom22 [Macrophomina phaseolina]
MVKLEEVPDEDLYAEQTGPHTGEDDWDDASSTTSDASSDVSSILAPEDETLWERVAALQDMIPASQRRFAARSYDNVSSWLGTGLRVGAKCLWVVSSSALLLGVPWALAYAEEQQMIEMEREMKMQQSANELLAPGSAVQQPAEARPAL